METSIESTVEREYEVRDMGGQLSTAAVGAAASLTVIASGALKTPVAYSAMNAVTSSVPYSGVLIALTNPIFQALPIVSGFAAVNDSPEVAAVAGGTAVAWSLYSAAEAYSWGHLTFTQAAYAFTGSLLPIAGLMVIGGVLGLIYLGARKLVKSKGNYEKRKSKTTRKSKSKKDSKKK